MEGFGNGGRTDGDNDVVVVVGVGVAVSEGAGAAACGDEPDATGAVDVAVIATGATDAPDTGMDRACEVRRGPADTGAASEEGAEGFDADAAADDMVEGRVVRGTRWR